MNLPFCAVRMKGFCGLLRSPPAVASPFGRLGPLATRSSTGTARFTLAPFRVRIPSKLDKEKRTAEAVLFSLVRMKGFEPP